METSIVKRISHSVIYIADRLKPLAALFLFLLFAFTLSAQEREDSVFTFRFTAGDDGFYYRNNDGELARMYECVELYRDLIENREIPVYVDGYSVSKRNLAENLTVARTRSNRVKSELITHGGLKEDNFVTRNHTGQGDFVTVRFAVPKERVREDGPVAVMTEKVTNRRIEYFEVPETVEEADSVSEAPQGAPADSTAAPLKVRGDSRFALKTNLLFYAALMPNVEVEWKFARRWSAALEGQMAWYSKTPPHKVYRIATVITEVRFWPVERSPWHGMYVGLFGGLGLYDLHKGYEHKGHEGEGYMVGLSVGYMWPISRHLSLDAGLGAGMLRARDKIYFPFDGHYLYQYTKNINYFGPLRLKLSLVWRIPW